MKQYYGVVVAFSGGVDSSLLLRVAKEVLNNRVIAVTAISPLYTKIELQTAREIASLIGVKHLVIRSKEMKNKNFVTNPVNRCYYCKIELFSALKRIARKRNYVVIEASNYSDLSDFRPGIEASKNLGIESPLLKVKLTKAEIRRLAKELGLPNWNKPSMACLASRIPYGTKIDKTILNRIERAEGFLHNLSFLQVRVRDYYPLARIEISANEFAKILKQRNRIIGFFKKIGYKYITLDLEGYRTGSMNQ